jgi:DNA repair protein RecO (recombination protein O)
VKLYHAEAIVLRTIAVREADRVLVLLTREYGKLRVWAHGAARPTSRKRGAVQPFCRSRFLLERSREIDVVRQAEVLENFAVLHADLKTLSLAGYLCELVDGFAPEGQPDPGFYRLLLQALRRLGGEKQELLVRFFESRVLVLAGLRPELGVCAACGNRPAAGYLRISPAQGGVLCGPCQTKEPTAPVCRPATLQVLGKMLDWPLDRIWRLRVDAGTRRELAAVLHSYLCHHLEREPKSLIFLRKLGDEA